MKKSSSTIKSKQRAKNFSFFTRITSLFILAAAIIISAVFSINYLDQNSNLSIEFAGGYQAQVKYEGIYEDSSDTQKVVDLLENRIDPLGTSNINIEKNGTSAGSFYNVSISKSSNVALPIFINNIARRGYVYLVDEQGHDLLANSFADKTWSARDKRVLASEVFRVMQGTNNNSGQPEVIFNISDSNLLKMISDVMTETSGNIYFYSDIGGLLNYVRNTWTGLQELVSYIDDAKESKRPALMALLANSTDGFGFDDDTGQAMYAAVKSSNPNLIALMDQAKNGVFMINWKYNDTPESTDPLSVDTNDKDNVFNPDDPFLPEAGKKASPMNAWLPYINKLIILSDVSKALETSIVNYKYAPYYIGAISPQNIQNNQIIINDDTFNKEKVQQIVNVVSAGMAKNNFAVQAILSVDPTLGAQSLKVAMIGLLVALILLAIAMIFNYRLLGVVAVFVILLFLVATLVTFIFLNNVVAPEIGIALIIGFALLLDTIVGLFNRMQKEYKSGKTVFDAFKTANKKSLVSAFDCSVIVLIVSLTIFWFGTRSIRGFAIMTSISTFGVILFGILFLRLILYLLLKNNIFENKAEILSLTQDKLQTDVQVQVSDLPEQEPIIGTPKISKKAKFANKVRVKLAVIKETVSQKVKATKNTNFWNISQWNFWHKATKWVMAGFGAVLLSSGIVYLATGSNFGAGFDSRIDFIADTAVDESQQEIDLWTQAEATKNEVVQTLNDASFSYQKVYASLILDSLGTSHVIRVIIQTNIKSDAVAYYRDYLDAHTQYSWISTDVAGLSGNQLFIDMLIVIAISLITIFIYVVVRFQLTFTVPLLAAIIFAVTLTLALLALFHITITTMTIGVILALVILVLINSVVIFDNIKEIKLNNHDTRNHLTKNEIIAISNDGIKKSLSRTLAVNSIIILTALVILCFLPSFWSVSLALMLGTIVTFIATHFVSPWLWTFFERRRIKRYQKRAEKIKKHFVGPDEYIIEGVND